MLRLTHLRAPTVASRALRMCSGVAAAGRRSVASHVTARAGLHLSHPATTASRPCVPSARCFSTHPATTDATPHTNPLLRTTSLPLYSQITAQHIRDGCTELFASLDAQFTEVERRLTQQLDTAPASLTYAAVVPHLEHITDRLSYVWGTVSHLSSVRDADDLREAIEAVEPRRLELALRLGQSAVVLRSLKSLESSSSLTSVQRKVVGDMLLEARLSGVLLADGERARFNELSQRLAKLSTTFSHNVLDATKAFRLTITESEVVDGLPDTVREMYAQHARESEPKIHGATAANGPWRVGLAAAHLIPFLTHCGSRPHRELLHRAYLSRASIYDGFDNAPVLAEILATKHAVARMLGFESYAHQSLASKLVKEPTKVESFLEELRSVAFPHAQQDLADLQSFAVENGFPAGQSLRSHDAAYWSDRMQKALYAFDAEQLRPFLPFPRVLQGLWSLIEHLFAVRVVERPSSSVGPGKEVDTWHEDVKYFDVYKSVDGAEQLIAGFFVDAYSRPSEKRGGAWMGECIGRARLADGTVRLPVAYLICNQQPPTGDRPSLMSFDELTTLFHEFGHVSQHLLTTVDESSVAGIRGVEWDAVELASQFLENFCYERATLNQLAAHVDTGAPLPSEIYDALIRAKNFRAGSALLRQVHFATLDMALHRGHLDGLPATEAALSADKLPQLTAAIASLERTLTATTSVMPYDPQARFLHAFSHLFAGGYAAGYYSYKWSEVMSADAFAAFTESIADRPSDAESARRWQDLGKRYRDTVLALGGSVPAAEVFRAFRGRDPSTAPLLKDAGLIQTDYKKN